MDLWKFVTPLFRMTTNHIPEQGWSGVLLSIQASHFVLTAAHVVDEGFVWFPLDKGFRELCLDQGASAITQAPGGRRHEDKIDLAIVRIPKGSIVLPTLEFLPLGACELRTNPHSTYSFVGYPYRLEDLDRVALETRPQPRSLSLTTVTDNHLNKLGYRRDTHIVVQYPRGKMINNEAHRVSGALPEGMSGGAVFQDYPGGGAKLAGIAIECVKDCLVGVRITCAVEMIRKTFPELAIFIPSASGGKTKS